MQFIKQENPIVKIVNTHVGSPTELLRQLKREGMRYSKVSKGFNTFIVVRKIKGNELVEKIKL